MQHFIVHILITLKKSYSVLIFNGDASNMFKNVNQSVKNDICNDIVKKEKPTYENGDFIFKKV